MFERRTLLAGGALLCAAVAAGQYVGIEAQAGRGTGGVAGGGIGPDVTYQDIHDIDHFGPIGGIHAYSLGSRTCNLGDDGLDWINDGTPALAMNAYRLHDGRFEQIGLGFSKTACCVVNSTGCGTCQSGFSGLRPGCRDTYSAGFNSSQFNLAPRSVINNYTGVIGNFTGTTGNDIFRRLQIAEADMSSTNFAGALYFVEGIYTATDDTMAGNNMNNAGWRRVTVGTGFTLNLADSTNTQEPAIMAWKDNVPSVVIQTVDVPGEGRFYLAGNAQDNGDGTWRYTYAVYNYSSDLSGGSLKIPLPSGSSAMNIGFNDVDYHSDDANTYDQTDWGNSQTPTRILFESPQTFAENPNSNAIRWGTMYTFWFDVEAPPTTGTVELGLFKSTDTVSAKLPVPLDENPGDLDGDMTVGQSDLGTLLAAFMIGDAGDLNGDGMTTQADLGILLAEYDG